MSALTQEFMVSQETWKRHLMPLKAGTKGFKGGTAVIETATGTVKPATEAAGEMFIGTFSETVDNTTGSASTPINVDFIREIPVLWRDNDGTITAANIGTACYMVDDHTVTLTATSDSKAGTILAVDSVLGVAFAVPSL